LGGCATTRAVLDPPAGFAVFAGESLWRAVSPEGVVMRARLVVNDPPQTLTFWAQALKTQMERSGYTLTAEESLLSPGGPGILYEWAAPVGEEDWIYLTALFVLDKRIALTEAAGEFTLYRKHRPAILNSLGTLALR
jgi:hypothetical protein